MYGSFYCFTTLHQKERRGINLNCRNSTNNWNSQFRDCIGCELFGSRNWLHLVLCPTRKSCKEFKPIMRNDMHAQLFSYKWPCDPGRNCSWGCQDVTSCQTYNDEDRPIYEKWKQLAHKHCELYVFRIYLVDCVVDPANDITRSRLSIFHQVMYLHIFTVIERKTREPIRTGRQYKKNKTCGKNKLFFCKRKH